jgi:hypothetical protein
MFASSSGLLVPSPPLRSRFSRLRLATSNPRPDILASILRPQLSSSFSFPLGVRFSHGVNFGCLGFAHLRFGRFRAPRVSKVPPIALSFAANIVPLRPQAA